MERVAMRARMNARGQMRVVETILASFIIIFALSFVNIYAIIPTSPKYEVTDLEKMGYSALHDLDKNGLLVPFVYNEQWGNITAALSIMLPIDVYFNMTVYDLNGVRVNTSPMFCGDSEAFRASKSVASVSYTLVGYKTTYEPRILILQLVRG